MLYIYPETVESVRRFIQKRWPEKEVSCQPNENARHENRFIQITVTPKLEDSIIHYEYRKGYLELHLEGEYYGDSFNQRFYQYLRNRIDTRSGEYLWHKWYDIRQGLLRLEYRIEDAFELSEALSKFINFIDPLVEEFLSSHNQDKDLVPHQFSDLNAANDIVVDNEGKVVLETLTLGDVFALNLKIPDYQRIYCWPQKNVELLLDDIFIPRGHEYHLGTIILQKKNDGYDIIDGQQRTVTLALILRALGIDGINLLNERFDSVEAQKYVAYNRYLIEMYLLDELNINYFYE